MSPFVAPTPGRMRAETPTQFFAAIAEGDRHADRLFKLCADCGVRILARAPADGRFEIGDTLAIEALCWLFAERGEKGARRILAAMTAARCAPIAAVFIRAAALAFEAGGDRLDDGRLVLAVQAQRRANVFRRGEGARAASRQRLAAIFMEASVGEKIPVDEARLRVLESEIGLLTAKVRELEDGAAHAGFGVRAAFGLTMQEDAFLRWLMARDSATADELHKAIRPGFSKRRTDKIVEVIASKLRAKLGLAMFGGIERRWDGSYALGADARAMILARRPGKVVDEAPALSLARERQEAADCPARSAHCLLPTAGADS